MSRIARIVRTTAETDIELELDLDGAGRADIDTGIGFLDHLLSTLTRHGRFDLTLRCQGDLEVDDHHTAEDTALALGAAFDEALGERRGIGRFAWSFVPLDEALARAVVDFSGRPFPVIELGLEREKLGELACENITHWLQSFAYASRCALHVRLLSGANDHHRAEAAFKATALALRGACALDGSTSVPSTKGVLA